MAQFLRSVLQQDVALAVSTVQDPVDLPVNPLSHILLTIKALNDTGTIGDHRFLTSLMAFISNIEVTFKGQAIISGSLADLAILNCILTGFTPWQGNVVETTNSVRMATFILSFTRKLYAPDEAFPAVRRGELQMRLTSGAAPTGLDTLVLQTETVELLDVQPARFLKYTTHSKTPSATGDHDVDLPIGNPILGVLLFGTTVPTGAVFTASINQIRSLIDNVEVGYANSNWETIHGELGRRLKGLMEWQGHIHSVNAAGAGREDTEQQEVEQDNAENYAYMDFDPLMDGQYALQTANRARTHLKIDAGVADAIRVIPVELMNVSNVGRSVAAR